MAHYGLLVDVKRKRSLLSQSISTCLMISTSSLQPDCYALFRIYPTLIRPINMRIPLNHGVTHHVLTIGHPNFVQPSKLAGDRLHIGGPKIHYLLA